MPGGTRPKSGRKPINIDLGELEKLSSLQCTHEEIAAWFNVSVRTIESRRKQRAFAEVMERGRAKGRISVRRAQMRLVEQGNAAMGIWLGKQLLGQRDVTPIELSGPSGQPVHISLEAIDAVLAGAEEKKRTRTCSNP
jgi:hypothetical protein